MDKNDLIQTKRDNIRRRAGLEQRTATVVERLKANPGIASILEVVMADWDANGACAALDRYPKEVHDWIRELAGWALMYLSLEAMEHLVEDMEMESKKDL